MMLSVLKRPLLWGCVLIIVFSGSSLAKDLDYLDFLMQLELNHAYETELLERGRSETLEGRWELMAVPMDDLSGASGSYSLLTELLGGRDLADLDSISGFITEKRFLDHLSFPTSPGISRQLLILQSSLYSFAYLCRINTPSSLGIAHSLMNSLEGTETFRNIVYLLGEGEYKILYDPFSTTRNIYEKVYGGSFT